MVNRGDFPPCGLELSISSSIWSPWASVSSCIEREEQDSIPEALEGY